MQKIRSLKKIGLFLVIIVSYFSINLLFNFNLWRQVFESQPKNKLITIGESPFYEYIAEKVYQNIKSGHNPFSTISDVLYPFGWNYAIDDGAPINGFLFLFLRPFFSIHQSFVLILLTGIFLSNLSMYYLLRLLNIKRKTAFLMGLTYGFTPFLAIRIGHPTYTALYLFPLLMILILKLYKAKSLSKYIYALLLGLAFAITFLTNIYFSLQIIVLCLTAIIFYFFTNRRFLFNYLKKEYKYISISLFIACFTLFSWFIKIYDVLNFRQYAVPPSFIDSIAYSADLFGIFIGGNFNPFFLVMKLLFGKTAFLNYPFFENFIYPGIIILLFYLFYFCFKHKLSKPIIKKIQPLLIISLFFWVLTLGPFLHIFGWNSSIPLPFIIINNLPFIQLARAPGRFIVPLVFLSSIATAFAVNYLLENKLKTIKHILFFCLILVFFLDQGYLTSSSPELKIPIKIYEYLAAQKTGTLLEIPFVIRDGLRFLGAYHTIHSPLLQLIHKKPIFGLYAGRINEDIFTYFKRDPFIGYFAKMIDQGKSTDINLTQMLDSIDFFNIENIILKTNENYSQKAKSIIDKLGYKRIISDSDYDLYYQKINSHDFDNFDLNSFNKDLFLGQGWSDKERAGKWVVGNIANILFKEVDVHPLILQFKAKIASRPQEMYIYLNKKYYGKIYLSQGFKSYTLEINKNIKRGINILTLKFSETIQPSAILKNNDKRQLAAYFSELSLNKNDKQTLEIKKQKPEINKIDFSSKQDELYLLEGWSDPEPKARWIEGKQALVEFPLYQKKKPTKLHIRAEAIVKPQRILIYINKVFSQSLIIKHGMTDDYYIDLKNLLKIGSNIITLKSDSSYLLGKVLGNKNDIRSVSIYVKYLSLEN